LAADDPYPGDGLSGANRLFDYTVASTLFRPSSGERDEMAVLQEAIDRLPPKCREIFLLSRFSKLSYKEIASSLDISPKTVENQLGKALKLLRAYLKANGVGLALILSLIFP